MALGLGWLRAGIARVLEALQARRLLGASAVVIALFLVYYAVQGAGQTVITEFYVPETLRAEAKGLDSTTLLHQLIVDLDRIRTVQNAARDVEVDLVEGLRGLRPRTETRGLTLKGRVQGDYNALIANVGSIEWGPIRLAASALLRPFQKLIRQSLVRVTLQRDGDDFQLLASLDDGGGWVVTRRTAARFIPDLPYPPAVADLVRALAYAMAFSDGRTHEPSARPTASYYFHRGTQRIIEYNRLGPAISPSTGRELLTAAIADFREALAHDPGDGRARYNLILATLQRSVFVGADEQRAIYAGLVGEIKDLRSALAFTEAAQRLLVADLVLLAEADRIAGRHAEALEVYEKVKRLLEEPEVQAPEVQAYVLNNMGLAHEALGRLSVAREHYRRAVEVLPSYARAQVNVGNTFFAEGRFAEAEAAYGKALERTPDHGGALHNLALLYIELRLKGLGDSRFVREAPCLRAQAHQAARVYVAQLEHAQLRRNLSPEERRDLERGRDLLGQIDAAGQESTPPRKHGECLKAHR